MAAYPSMNAVWLKEAERFAELEVAAAVHDGGTKGTESVVQMGGYQKDPDGKVTHTQKSSRAVIVACFGC